MSDVPEGYKMSEVGVIPEEWEVKTLGDVSEIIMGQSPAGNSYNQNANGIALINGPTEFTEKYPIKIQWTTLPTKLCKEGDILLCIRGSSTGRMNISNDSYCIGRGVAAIRAKVNLDCSFLEFQVQNIVKNILALTTGSTFPNIDGRTLKNITVAFPPLPEQQAIASALSDVDALITALEQLITKKRNIKQGAMQQLLTGKKRLPGFGGAWEMKILNEVVDFLDGKRRPIKDSDRAKMRGQFPYYGASGIIDYVNDYIFDDNLILLGEDGENIISRNSRLVFQISGKVWVNNHAHVLKPKPDTDIAFLTEYLESLNYELYNTGTAQPKLNQKVCSSIPVILPSLPEQQAIAQILSDMDTEIESLEQKRDKYKVIKQGMMQELLSGKTRLAKEDKT
jgi:type I restriction enzyme S subunit